MYDIVCLRVVVLGLFDIFYINYDFFGFELIVIFWFCRWDEMFIVLKYVGNMCVFLEIVFFDEVKDFFDFFCVIDVFGKNVFC